MTYLWYSLLFVGLYSFLGLGLTWLLSPPELKRYGLLLSPTVGYCYMTLAGWYCLVAGVRGTDAYAAALCVPPLGFLLFALARERRNRGSIRTLLSKDAGIASVVAVTGFVAISLPSILSPHGLTAMSLGNVDIIYYAHAARYLKGFKLGEVVGFMHQAPIARGGHDRFGTVLATALPSTLFSLEPYQLPNVLMYVFFAFGVLALVYVVGREIFGYTPFGSALGVVLVAANPLLYYTTYHIFEAQIIAMAVALALAMLHLMAARTALLRSSLRYAPLSVLMTWGLSVTYGHMLPLFLAAMAIPVLLLAWQRQSTAVVTCWIGFCLVTGAATLACSLERGRLVAEQLLYFSDRYIGGLTPGWVVPWLVPAGLFTIPHAFPLPVIPGYPPLAWASGAAFLVLLAWALVGSYRSDRERFTQVAAWSIVTLGGGAGLMLTERSASVGYGSYKWISFFLPLVLLCLVAPLAGGDRWRRRHAWCAILLVVVLLGSGVYSAQEMAAMRGAPCEVRPDMPALQAVEANPDVGSINILGVPGDYCDTMWKTYFLMRKTLYPERPSYWSAEKLVGDWDLHSVDARGRLADDDGVLQLRDDDNDPLHVIHVNAGYTLTRARDLRVEYGPGWHGREVNLRWTGNGSAVAQLLLGVAAERQAISIDLTYLPWNARNQLSVYLNGELLARCPDKQACAVARAELRGGGNVLEFRPALPPERPGNDSRELGYAFTKIEIRPIP